MKHLNHPKVTETADCRHGVVLLDKPHGMSSQTAVLGVRKALGASKAGHTGTLDPLATGLLPIALGEATKFTQGLLDADKVYEVTVRLGARSESGDQEGPIEVLIPPEAIPSRVSDEALAEALRTMTGWIDQLPPQYAAIKVQGRPLYDYARAGLHVDVPARKVHIWACDLLGRELADVRLRVHCSKGTYIRSLARDIGELLGVGGYVLALRRTQVGHLSIADAFSWGDWSKAKRFAVDALCAHLPCLALPDDLAERLLHGQRLSVAVSVLSGLMLDACLDPRHSQEPRHSHESGNPDFIGSVAESLDPRFRGEDEVRGACAPLVRVYRDSSQTEIRCWLPHSNLLTSDRVLPFLGLAVLQPSQRGDGWRVIAPQRLFVPSAVPEVSASS